MVFLLLSDKIMATGFLFLLQVFGVVLGIWSVWAMKINNLNVAPEVKKNAVFVESGPYYIIRNPMYASLMVFFGTGLLQSFQLVKFIVFLILVLVFIFKIHLEEKFLEDRFGKIYLDYKKKTYRLIPYLV